VIIARPYIRRNIETKRRTKHGRRAVINNSAKEVIEADKDTKENNELKDQQKNKGGWARGSRKKTPGERFYLP
jgi:hypothetical protein